MDNKIVTCKDCLNMERKEVRLVYAGKTKGESYYFTLAICDRVMANGANYILDPEALRICDGYCRKG